MAATAILLRSDWRRRGTAIIAVALLVGLAGGFVLTAAAGARRTATSLERLESESRSGDVTVDVGADAPDTISTISGLPMVAESGAFSLVFAVIEGVEEDLGLFIPRDTTIGVRVERDRLLRGRSPDPGRIDEVVMNERAANLTGSDVGDDITIATMTPEQVANEEYFPTKGPNLVMRVVGVTRGPYDLGSSDGGFIASPALWDTVSGRVDVFTTIVSVRLAEGATIAKFNAALRAAVPADADLQTLALDARVKPARDAISALAAGLTVFALVAAIAGAVIAGQAVGRHLSVVAADQPILATLGMSRRSRRTALILSVAPIAVGGALIAVVGALVASSTMPIGLARRAEPDPGFSVDGVVVALGGVAVATVVVVAAAIVAWSLTREAVRSRAATAPSAATATALRWGAGPVVANGVRLALDRRRPSLPVRSTIAGVTVAVIGAVGVLTFAASLDRLVSTPARWGYPWDVSLNFNSDDVGSAADKLAHDSRLAEVARWDSGFSYINGEGRRAYGLAPLRGDVGFSLRSGRQPVDASEIVLGPVTADHLDVAIGDTVEVAATPDAKPATVRVVGTALFPEIDEGNFTDGVGYYGSAFAARATVPDLFEASQIVVAFAPGHADEAVVASLNEQFPDSLSGESRPLSPGSVANLAALRTFPKWLAGFVIALGLASLVHILATTFTRRRRELATLRSIGLTPGQTVGCIVSQALTLGIAGLLVGIPLGLVAGRAAWWATADPIGVVTAISIPWLGLAAIGIGALVGAVLVAALLSFGTSRRTPAEALRAE